MEDSNQTAESTLDSIGAVLGRIFVGNPARGQTKSTTHQAARHTSQLAFAFAIWCGIAIVLSAFLVFQIQPVISKMILPWFGGGPAVWASCMMFFQLVLLAGYAYAYTLNRVVPLRWQAVVHLGLVIIALAFLPIMPSGNWKPVDGSNPTFRILWILTANIGLPYFLLSATAPLFQAWFAAKLPGRVPYRLYALSNVGSLGALLSFPFVIEPLMTSSTQGFVWSVGFVIFAVCSGILALIMWRTSHVSLVESQSVSAETDSMEKEGIQNESRISTHLWFGWLLLAAFGSFALLSISNHICQELTVSPLMWVLPLSIYLVTFIISFERPQWFVPRIWAVVAVGSLFAFAMLNHDLIETTDAWMANIGASFAIADYQDDILAQTAFSLLALFLVCMLCHGELVRLKPDPSRLTSFYMAMATGGAVGGMTVVLICPVVFSTFFETQITLIGGLVVAVWMIFRAPAKASRTRAAVAGILGGGVGLVGLSLIVGGNWSYSNPDTFLEMRNFYGVLRVDLEESHSPDELGRGLYHGSTLHGFQFIKKQHRNRPTTYYSTDSGLAVAIGSAGKEEKPIRVGLVGLGAGTSAAYGRPGDYYHFYEINPDVIKLASNTFTFLEDCPADVDITLSDARVAMERQPAQNYDVIVLDAFSGDAIPAHLLTVEAFEVYSKHLKKGGIIAVHVSNRYLNLFPVVAGSAVHHGFEMVAIDTDYDDSEAMYDASSSWLLLSDNEEFLNNQDVQAQSSDLESKFALPITWTDQYSNLIEVLD